MTVFVTRDEKLAGTCGEAAAEALGVQILSPIDVVLKIDELGRAEEYQPAALLGTGYQDAEAGVGSAAATAHFADARSRESARKFLAHSRRFAREPQTWHRRLIRDGAGAPAAFYIYGTEDRRRLMVPVLRVTPSRLGNTLARQILFRLRNASLELGCPILRLADPHLPPWIARAGQLDGMIPIDEQTLEGLVIDRCGPAALIDAAVADAQGADVASTLHLRAGMPALAASEIERALWPAKITDSDIPSYVAPIQARWSTVLFGVPRNLFSHPDELGLSREHVYYRSPRGPRISAPARILWYLSKGSPDRPHAAVFACSLLDAVVVGNPTELHERFRHLGVWQLPQIQASARDGLAQALRFTNTELLPEPVPRPVLDDLSRPFGHTLQLQSPRKIPPALFEIIYRKGRGTGDQP